MTATLSDTDRSAFSDADARSLLDVLDEAQRTLATTAEVPADVERRLWEVTGRLPTGPGAFAESDPFLANAVLTGTLAIVQALREADGRRARRELRLALEQTRQALRDLLHDEVVASVGAPADLARWMTEEVEVGKEELAALAGVSPRTIHRWLAADGTTQPSRDDAARLRIVARAANQLRHVLTGRGVTAWFRQPSEDLGGRRPIDLLDDPARFADVVATATRFRSTVAT